MSENETENTDRNWAQAREKISKLEADNTHLRELALAGIAHQAGYDTNHGVTKLLLEKFAGSVEDIKTVSTETFTEFAKGLNVEPNLAAAEVEAPAPNEDRTAETQMETLQARADQLGAEVRPPEFVSPDEERLREAEANGDVVSAIALKMRPFLQDQD